MSGYICKFIRIADKTSTTHFWVTFSMLILFRQISRYKTNFDILFNSSQGESLNEIRSSISVKKNNNESSIVLWSAELVFIMPLHRLI